MLSEFLGVCAVAWILARSPRFRRAPIGFLYPRRDGIIALGLFGLLLALALLYHLGVFEALAGGAPILPQGGLPRQLFLSALSFLPVLAALFYRKQPGKSLGWSRNMLSPGLQMGFALALLTVFLSGKVSALINSMDQAKAVNALLLLGIAALEESIFRGYLQLRLIWWLGKGTKTTTLETQSWWLGWAVTSILFVLWQAPGWIHLAPETLAATILITTVRSFVLGFVMQKTGHVAAPILYRAVSEWMLTF